LNLTDIPGMGRLVASTSATNQGYFGAIMRANVHDWRYMSRGRWWFSIGILLFCSSRPSCGLIAQRPFSESTTRVSDEFKKWLPV
jgi:hypothetical protein